eukprot:6480864-Amphidinium_carterae.1
MHTLSLSSHAAGTARVQQCSTGGRMAHDALGSSKGKMLNAGQQQPSHVWFMQSLCGRLHIGYLEHQTQNGWTSTTGCIVSGSSSLARCDLGLYVFVMSAYGFAELLNDIITHHGSQHRTVPRKLTIV